LNLHSFMGRKEKGRRTNARSKEKKGGKDTQRSFAGEGKGWRWEKMRRSSSVVIGKKKRKGSRLGREERCKGLIWKGAWREGRRKEERTFVLSWGKKKYPDR